MSPGEQATMTEHAVYGRKLAESGRAVAYGLVNDPAGVYGIGIVIADDLAAAEAL
jgi:uncharacterized protein